MTMLRCPSCSILFLQWLKEATSWYWCYPSWFLGQVPREAVLRSTLLGYLRRCLSWDYTWYMYSAFQFAKWLQIHLSMSYSIPVWYSLLTWGEGMGWRELCLFPHQEGKCRKSRPGRIAKFKTRKMGLNGAVSKERRLNVWDWDLEAEWGVFLIGKLEVDSIMSSLTMMVFKKEFLKMSVTS